MRHLSARARAEDWEASQTIARKLGDLCRTLAGEAETAYRDCKSLDASREARVRYYERIDQWMARAKSAMEFEIAAHGGMEFLRIAFKVSNLEQHLSKYVDVGPVVRARARSRRVDTDKNAPEPSNPAKILTELEESYQDTFRKMEAYEASRAEDVSRMDKLDVELNLVLNKIDDRLRIIDGDRSPLRPGHKYTKEILEILVSDKTTDMITTKSKELAAWVHTFTILQTDVLRQNMLGDIWRELLPSLALVDAVEPMRR
ncbi:hypothetical protein DXG01_003048 [Tephrocybe rancida]|nr:hypothetical protein DXG01_003048 [Tephrocybe rancida]